MAVELLLASGLTKDNTSLESIAYGGGPANRGLGAEIQAKFPAVLPGQGVYFAPAALMETVPISDETFCRIWGDGAQFCCSNNRWGGLHSPSVVRSSDPTTLRNLLNFW